MDRERLRGMLGIGGVLGGLVSFWAGSEGLGDWLYVLGIALFVLGYRLIRGVGTTQRHADYTVPGERIDGGLGGGGSDGDGASGGDGD